MSAFTARVAEVTGAAPEDIERLAGGDLSEVLLVRRADATPRVAKGGRSTGTEAAMLRAIAAAAVPAPGVEGEYPGLLLLEHIENDGVFSPAAWRSIGAGVRRLHRCEGERYGWPTDYSLGTVELANGEAADWPGFWAEKRLIATARILDRPWRERVERVAARIGDMLPPQPPPALLHGDLWAGNILVHDGQLAALIDPACYHGHSEADLAMLTLFASPSADFWESYGAREPGWEEREPVYQLFPALVHLRLFGAAYEPMVDRLLGRLRA